MMNTKLLFKLTPSQIDKLKEVAAKFSKYSQEQVKEYMWNLTYKPVFALEKMGLSDPEYLSSYKKVRNYVLEESGHASIINFEIDEEIKQLYFALQQDKFAVKKVKDTIDCIVLLDEIEDLERIEFLLSSDKKRNNYGGLKALRLNDDEALFFMVAIKSISEYFTFRLNEVKENIRYRDDSEPEEVIDVVSEMPEIECTEEEVQVDLEESQKILNRIKKLLEKKEEILKFYEVFDILSEEFDMNLLYDNREFVKIILNM